MGSAYFIVTLSEYLDDWTPEYGAYTKPGADAHAGSIFEEPVQVTLDNGSWMKIPCKLELLEDATIFWDVSINKNITFNLNQGNDMSAYIGATSDAKAPYTIKWGIEKDAEITGIKGPSGSTSAGNKTNNIVKPMDKIEFLGSTVTVRPTSTI